VLTKIFQFHRALLLGYTSIKASCKMLVKLTPGVSFKLYQLFRDLWVLFGTDKVIFLPGDLRSAFVSPLKYPQRPQVRPSTCSGAFISMCMPSVITWHKENYQILLRVSKFTSIVKKQIMGKMLSLKQDFKQYSVSTKVLLEILT